MDVGARESHFIQSALDFDGSMGSVSEFRSMEMYTLVIYCRSTFTKFIL